MSAARRWTLIIAGLLVGNVVAVAVLFGFAHGGAQSQVVPDYYRRAVDWDRDLPGERRAFWHLVAPTRGVDGGTP